MMTEFSITPKEFLDLIPKNSIIDIICEKQKDAIEESYKESHK